MSHRRLFRCKCSFKFQSFDIIYISKGVNSKSSTFKTWIYSLAIHSHICLKMENLMQIWNFPSAFLRIATFLKYILGFSVSRDQKMKVHWKWLTTKKNWKGTWLNTKADIPLLKALKEKLPIDTCVKTPHQPNFNPIPTLWGKHMAAAPQKARIQFDQVWPPALTKKKTKNNKNKWKRKLFTWPTSGSQSVPWN